MESWTVDLSAAVLHHACTVPFWAIMALVPFWLWLCHSGPRSREPQLQLLHAQCHADKNRVCTYLPPDIVV